LDKEKDFEKEYKHNIKIWRKQKIENEQNIKTLILKMKEHNEKFKEKIGLMKSLIEELKELRKVAKV
jgi:ribosome maturation factor RimP